jgi:hypothetical protein
MSVIWSWTYFYNLHWNNYLYFKGLLYIWEEIIMMALLHMASLENSECIWKIQRKPSKKLKYSETWQNRISVETEQISKSRRNPPPINAYLTWMNRTLSLPNSEHNLKSCKLIYILQIHLINPNTLFVVP